MHRCCIALALAVICVTSASATDYDEAVDGDLSGDPAAPTDFPLTPGDNLLTATSVGGDVEYFLATIPAGHELSAILLDSYSNTFGLSFIAVQSGTMFTEPAMGTDPANLLGYHLFGVDDLGLDILSDMGAAVDAVGFTPPLPAGEFTFWSQETGGEVTYSYRFQVSAVPEPSSLVFALCLLSLAILRRDVV